ncbi:transposase [Xanthomonas citri pv. citri]|nr:transposase [Xanthomonas citri pv. citri]MBD1536458.1 transposase [Xanthomonas citri pv. citri]
MTKFRRTAPSRPYDGLAEFSEEHKPRVAQLLVTAATLERGYQAFRESGNLQVFQPHDNELGSLHRQWLSDLDSLKTLRAARTDPKALEYVNEAFACLAGGIKQLAE